MTLPNNPHAIVRIERSGMTDGQALVTYDTYVTKQLIKEISVDLATNQSSEARVTFFDPKFRVIDAFSNATAKAVATIYLGYGDDLGEPIFKGILAQIERGETDSTFVFFDVAYVMKLIKKSGYKNKKDDVGVIRDLVQRNTTPGGLKLQFEGPGESLGLEPHNVTTSDQMSDWDWMMERARAAGLVVYVRQDRVFVKKPARVSTPVLTIRNRVDFKLGRNWDFVYRTPENLDGRPKVVSHRRRGKDGKFLKGSSSESTSGRDETIIKKDQSLPSKSKLTKRARAQKELDREHAFEGRLSIPMPSNGVRLDYRSTVDIQGIGKLFSNKYICRTVNYRFGAGELAAELDLYRDIEE